MSRSAAFVDRDGTILAQETGRYCETVAEAFFESKSVEGLVRLAKDYALVIVVTNQAGLGYGKVLIEELENIHAWIRTAVELRGGRIDAFYVCTHRKDEKCGCRKPGTGLFERAVRDFDIDLTKSVIIGDSLHDLVAAARIGVRAALVLTGEGQKTLSVLNASGEHRLRCKGISIAGSLYEFAYGICETRT